MDKNQTVFAHGIYENDGFGTLASEARSEYGHCTGSLTGAVKRQTDSAFGFENNLHAEVEICNTIAFIINWYVTISNLDFYSSLH